ncbi:hypothetical protein OKW35_007218 [Paraburkholderia sp. MM5477-R1]
MTEEQQASSPGRGDLSTVAIALLKGVVYRDGNERLWAALLELQTHARDYVAVLGLELVVDEAEGYAFVKSRAAHDAEVDGEQAQLPRLVARRPLSFPVSLLLALLRKKLAEWDAGGGDTRLVLAREDIVELVRVFLPASTTRGAPGRSNRYTREQDRRARLPTPDEDHERTAHIRGAAHSQGVRRCAMAARFRRAARELSGAPPSRFDGF